MDGKWRHVGTKIESKIDVNFERPILQKVLKNIINSYVFSSFGSRSWHQKSIKDQPKIEAQDESEQKAIKNFYSLRVKYLKSAVNENRFSKMATISRLAANLVPYKEFI